jgi:hypothetical protein
LGSNRYAGRKATVYRETNREIRGNGSKAGLDLNEVEDFSAPVIEISPCAFCDSKEAVVIARFFEAGIVAR